MRAIQVHPQSDITMFNDDLTCTDNVEMIFDSRTLVRILSLSEDVKEL